MTSLAAPVSREERARSAVGVLAWLCLGAAVAGSAALFATERAPVWWAGWGMVLVALLLAVGCLRHGARREHERGRWPAVAAVVVALPALALASYGGLTRTCHPTQPTRCVEIGREEDR